jgi:hypothetical protein
MTTHPSAELVASTCDRMLAALVLTDGRLAWSSQMLDDALAATAEAVAGVPEPLLRSAWRHLAGRHLDDNVYELCRALGRAVLGGYRRDAGWDLTWMLGDAGPAQLCLRYWTLAVRPELWDEPTERATLAVLRSYPFAW